MTIWAYLRVSTSEQADSGLGLAAQRVAIEAEVSRKGWDGIEWITDAGYSAKSMKRPGLTDLLARIQPGDVLLAAKMDRISRSLLDFAQIVQTAQKQGWKVVALDSPADMSTASGEAMAGVMAVFSQLERRLISERTKAALAQRKAEGVRLGRPPVIGADAEGLALSLKAEGLSLRKIGAGLTEAGFRPPSGGEWYPTTVRGLLARSAA